MVKAEAMRPITPEEIQPISPDVGKRIVVTLCSNHYLVLKRCWVFIVEFRQGQNLTCGNAVDKWSLLANTISRKFIPYNGGGHWAGVICQGCLTSIFVTGGWNTLYILA
jgi:hypothetical protein